jgi:transposase-like protein
MIDLNKEQIDVTCDNGHVNHFTIGDVRARKRFKCHGCDQMISLQPDANFESTISKTQRELDDLKRTIDRFGR